MEGSAPCSKRPVRCTVRVTGETQGRSSRSKSSMLVRNDIGPRFLTLTELAYHKRNYDTPRAHHRGQSRSWTRCPSSPDLPKTPQESENNAVYHRTRRARQSASLRESSPPGPCGLEEWQSGCIIPWKKRPPTSPLSGIERRRLSCRR